MKTDANLTTNDRLTRLETTVAGLEVGQGQIVQELRDIKQTLGRGPNWQAILGGFAVLVAICIPSVGAMAMFVSFSIQTAISPLESKSDISIRDRLEQRAVLDQYGQRLIWSETMDSKMTEQLREVETQVKGIYDTENMRAAYEAEKYALLWREVKGYDYPSQGFYPQPKTMP